MIRRSSEEATRQNLVGVLWHMVLLDHTGVEHHHSSSSTAVSSSYRFKGTSRILSTCRGGYFVNMCTYDTFLCGAVARHYLLFVRARRYQSSLQQSGCYRKVCIFGYPGCPLDPWKFQFGVHAQGLASPQLVVSPLWRSGVVGMRGL